MDVEPSDTIANVKTQIQGVEGLPPNQQLLILAGPQLEDEKAVFYYNIPEGSVLHSGLSLRGMISPFFTSISPCFTSSDTSDELVNFLMLSDEERESTAVPLGALRAKAIETMAAGSEFTLSLIHI